MNWIEILDRPIAFYPIFVRLTGSVQAAVMLSQAFYWSKRTKDPDGWFYKSREEWETETSLKRGDQERARAQLRGTSFWQEKLRSVPAKLYFRIDIEKLEIALSGGEVSVTVEEVLADHAPQLRAMAKTGYMRAVKAGVVAEQVDYAEVLKAKGMICGICTKEITRPIGQRGGYLTFDYIEPLRAGGAHAIFNIQPAHVECATVKSGQAVQLALCKPTDPLTESQQAGLRGASKPGLDAASKMAAGNPTNTKTTQRSPSKITAETTQSDTARRRAVMRKSPETKRDFDGIINRTWVKWQNRFKDVLDTNQYSLTPKRKAMMRDRLEFGFTEENFDEGMEGLRLSDWHMARHPENRTKKYLSVEYIFKDDETLEKRIMDYREWKKQQPCEFCKGKGFVVRPAVAPENVTPVPADVWAKTLVEFQAQITPDADPQSAIVWQTVIETIRTKVQPESFATWIQPLVCVGVDHSTRCIRLGAQNQVQRDWVKTNYSGLLDQAFGENHLAGYSIEWADTSEEKVKALNIGCAGVNCDAVYLTTTPEVKNSLSGKRDALEGVIKQNFGKQFTIKWLIEQRMACKHD